MTQGTTETAPTPVYRKDYRPPDHWIDEVELGFELGLDETRVRARLSVRRNADVNDGTAPLRLDGEELQTLAVRLDGRALAPTEYTLEPEALVVPGVPDAFELETEVVIGPEANTALSGLYASSGNLCTQCEAHGFRRITWFLDRPDVMARYRVRLEADRERFPVLLANGNRVGQGELAGGRHFALWEDPFKKPCYLFALVAGDLACHRDSFTTRSGRSVPLEIWVEHRNLDRCAHAMESLKHAMRWDEDVFGLEIDLDLYMIFVADDFNMGAMENKGLNIFNSKYVLASPETATDADYDAIEGVVAHEYFHNWTGNRVTCRDWFQLTLKEGLTVFRDQQFSADRTSAPVQRIEDVNVLRRVQFPEDRGPMAHPIRPDSYLEMNNFYTATVYCKGAEVVRLYHTLLGEEGFRRGMDLYFERHDGQAVTCVDFRRAMADANGVDLEQMERWYAQGGTPTLRVVGEHDARAATYTLRVEQSLERIPDGVEPRPALIPLRMGLLGGDGRDLELHLAGEDAPRGTTTVLSVTEPSQSFTFTGIAERPVPSLLRGFSAPVLLECPRTDEELAFLMAHDSDPFNRWDAGQEFGRRLILSLAADHAAGRALVMNEGLTHALARILSDPALDGSLKAQALELPSEVLVGQSLDEIDPDALHAARRFAKRSVAAALHGELSATFEACAPRGPYSKQRSEVDRRRLRLRALGYLVALETPEVTTLAVQAFERADNMTDSVGSLACLLEVGGPHRQPALDAFHARWKAEPLVLDKWFSLQALCSLPGTLDRVIELASHPDFLPTNPNRVHALVTAFAMGNQVRFHDPSGRGYAFLADQVLALDGTNPQLASRVVSRLNQWKRFEPGRRAAMGQQLERIAATPGLSKDVTEIVGKALA